jgi:LTXXQ motif family protein
LAININNAIGGIPMWKAMLAGTTALTIVGASLVYAQQTPPTQQGRDGGSRFSRLSPEDRAALTDARIAGLKAGLKLTAAQEKNWPAVEAALRDRAKLRAERFEQFRKTHEQRRADPSQRGDILEQMRSRADNMATSAASMKKLADAIDPLYKSLDDGQKQRFALLYRARGEGEGRHHFWFRGRDGGPDQQMGPGPRGPGRQGPSPRQRRTENEL